MGLVTAEEVHKVYRSGDVDVAAVKGVSFTIAEASFVCFVGPSGSGKSTLLNMIGCLDRPTAGRLTVSGQEVGSLGRTAAAEFRGRHIGFVFQDFNLMPVLTVAENVEYPLRLVQRRPAAERQRRVMHLLERVGMADHAGKRPDQLSGGQKQRVAVARALVGEPRLVLADEPTANLDSDTAQRVIHLMKEMRDHSGTTFVFSTHDPRVVNEAEAVHRLEDGRLVDAATAAPEMLHA